LEIPTVGVVEFGNEFHAGSDDDLRKRAEGVYTESGKQREGIVIRPLTEMQVNGERLSFKVLNLNYKSN
jgi:hypothetical protein